MRRPHLALGILAAAVLFSTAAVRADELQNLTLTLSEINATTFLVDINGTQTASGQGITDLSVTGLPSSTTLEIRENVVNGMTDPWTDYHLTVDLLSTADLLSVGLTGPSGWTSNVVNNGGSSYTFNYIGGTSIGVGATGTFGFDLSFAGAGGVTFTTSGVPSTATVPEPTTLLLLGSGALGLFAIRRKVTR